ncbi:MAG: hypothetical protein PVG14_20265, partial [Anaerolineales bacterium]
MWKRLSVLGVLACMLFFYHGGNSHTIQADTLDAPSDTFVYLPIIQKPEKSALRVNAPHFEGDIPFSETAIFWFGQV